MNNLLDFETGLECFLVLVLDSARSPSRQNRPEGSSVMVREGLKPAALRWKLLRVQRQIELAHSKLAGGSKGS